MVDPTAERGVAERLQPPGVIAPGTVFRTRREGFGPNDLMAVQRRGVGCRANQITDNCTAVSFSFADPELGAGHVRPCGNGAPINGGLEVSFDHPLNIVRLGKFLDLAVEPLQPQIRYHSQHVVAKSFGQIGTIDNQLLVLPSRQPGRTVVAHPLLELFGKINTEILNHRLIAVGVETLE